ncbi:DUF4129 domain-containing protein [Nocardia yamanashiensis]|uniref:DUF4129 domain-containing protein n=1 Tax=Nocardia yamanashiensis TaxID=209247 RepID=UPI001E3DC56C|nr:DUF4129 domain-containing protein [Nocardia yamanashiensis]UGT40464.1 DUF4129 domain-containing protein [Nocardia yamanashiensis]
MTEPTTPPGQFAAPTPPPPALGPAAAHLAAAEAAAQRAEFGVALRERYRAVSRGLEQRGVLEVEPGRTAQETARAATTAMPAEAVELQPVAHSFDEIVYGGRPATEAEYRRLEHADRFSIAPPPKSEPVEVGAEKRKARKRRPARKGKGDREPVEWPALLRDWRFWAAILGALLLFLFIYALMHMSAPDVPDKPTTPPPKPETPDQPDIDPDFGEGDDSIFESLPGWLAFGGTQWLLVWVIVICWRGRRRGAVVGEPRPVEAPANELLTGQAGLYRKSRDHDHVAAKLRAAALRRLRPALHVTADAPPELVVAAIAGRTGADPGSVRAALYDPVADRATLELVAAQLEWIEAEVL